jgi:hypothetical protein
VAALDRTLPKIPAPAEPVHRAPGNRLLCLWDPPQPAILLEPGPPGGARMRWIKAGVDCARYKRLMLDRIVFFFAADSAYKGMDPRELKDLADLFPRQLAGSLKKSYPIASAPGPKVARLQFAITDLRENRPVLSDILPAEEIGPAGSDAKEGRLNSWSGSGATATELLVIDSTTNNDSFRYKKPILS